MLHSAGEQKFAVPESTLPTGDELTAEYAAEYLNRQEKSVARVNPALAVERQTAGRNYAVNMGMKASAPTIP
jgi:hypothetical protein